MSPIARLIRVRQRQEYNTGQQRGTGHHGEEVMLFEDYAVIDRNDVLFAGQSCTLSTPRKTWC